MSSSDLFKVTSPSVHGGYPHISQQPIHSAGGFSGGAPAGAAAGGKMPSTITVNGSGSLNWPSTTSVSGSYTIKTAPDYPVINMEPMLNYDTGIEFNELENGVWVRAILEMAHDLTPREAVRINLLATMASSTRIMGFGHPTPITFIRKHNLERHFSFSTP